LASCQMSGRKNSWFRITISLCCNVDSSEKRKPFFIGKSCMPQCFKPQHLEERGFYYCANQSAWMTVVLFQE
ncbi:uncharacterized protein FOMMEDRAFT_76824, partial [Fomitiporia mediterranea MF3/22]|uniref:uncharacterized protein n=1 Tax=Fomitiporia mediterranea (strain MF3/22) TaxID=694068 RepID=UPI00044094FC